nr:FkbM family methyltransferase [Thalassococcus arenae]
MKYVGDLDRKVSWVVDRCLRPGDTALDIGANLGLVTLRMADRVGSGGRVHAFEPQDRLRRYLLQSLTRNGLEHVVLHAVALAAEPGELVLHVPPDNAGAASLAGTEGAGQRVPVETLDRLAAAFGPTPATLVKIDVEGFEGEVLKGARTVLETTPPHVVLLEEHRPVSPHYPDSLRFLAERGYRLFGLPKTFLAVRLLALSDRPEHPMHDYVAISPGCPAHICRALGIAGGT